LSQSRRTEADLLKCIIQFVSEATPGYIAGGYVREMLLGQRAKDVDIVVPAAAISLARRLADHTGGAFFILDEETDAARIVYRKPVDLVVDVAAMRGPDIIADLKARDFTINAMAIDVCDCFKPQRPILDPCRGQRDLKRRLLRATSEQAFQQDPVRLLRALRFAATLSVRIGRRTESWIRRDAHLITRPSAERIRQELALIMAAQGAADHLRRMDELGLMRHVLPELAALKGVAQSDPHIHDVYEHTLVTVRGAERLGAFPHAKLGPIEKEFLSPFAADLGAHFGQTVCEGRKRSTLLKFAAMLHDVGKPEMRTLDEDGRIRAFGHEGLSAETAQKVLTRLRFSAQEIRLISTIVEHHMRPGWLLKEPSVTPRAIYRFFRDTGDAGVDVMILALADQLATRGDTLTIGHWRDYLGLAHRMLDNYFRRPEEVVAPPPLVSGNDVMSLLGLAPGPQVGKLLEAVREAQAEGLVRTKEDALDFLRQHPAG
jgi:tRNA nucleotidyltransferase/poly(A) polymerase